MNIIAFDANLPWVLGLMAACLVARLLIALSNARFNLRRFPAIHRCEEGSVQSLSFVLTLPFFIMIIMLIVQVSQIMIANIIVHQAAFAAVRSAIVWIPANVSEDEPANCISSISVINQTIEGIHYRVNSSPSSLKLAKIRQAAVLVCAPSAPSRDLGYPLDPLGQLTHSALTKLYAGLDSDSNSNRLISTRLKNKLAYAYGNTDLRLEFWHRVGPYEDYQDPNLRYHYDIGPYFDEFRLNELGWQDHVTATVTFNLPLLPGPVRLFANGSRINGGALSASGYGSPTVPASDGFGSTDITGRTFVFVLSASATMVNEGEKPRLSYHQEEF
jgi:hypothetical protein